MLRRLLFVLSALLLTFALALSTVAFAADLYAPVAQDEDNGGDGDGNGGDGNGAANGAATLPDTGAGTNLSIVLLGVGVIVLAGGLVVRRRTA
jgi:LPXTG-motif cell wall-anchored protein